MTKHILDCIFIETTTACTRKCPWCTHHYYDIKPNFMSENLFQKIITDLSSLNYSGRLSFYLNGEPLLDKRLSEWVKAGKKACPDAFTFIISNGDLFTAEKVTELIHSGLDAIKVNTYDEKTLIKVQTEMKKINPDIIHHVRLYDHSNKTDWTSRGGTVPFGGKQNENHKKTVCLRPFRQMYVAQNGVVAQCCSDALNKYVMGDMNTQSLMEIWNGEEFNKVRNSLLGKSELNDLCKICDLERIYENVNDLKGLFQKSKTVLNQPDNYNNEGEEQEKISFLKNPLKSIKQIFNSHQQQ